MSEDRAPYGDPEPGSTDNPTTALAEAVRRYLAIRGEYGFEQLAVERKLAEALARWDRQSAL